MKNEEMARLFSEATPYIQKYHGRTMVIKYGGNAMINEELKDAVMHDVVLLKLLGMKPVLSHGGGPGINKMLEKLNIPVQFINGLRYTSEDIMRVVEMVLVGQVNTELVGRINQIGGKAVGLSGVSGDIYHCHKRSEELGFVGDIDYVNADAINAMLDAGFIPVIAPVGTDGQGHTFNINGDTAAGKLASALGAEKLVILTDIEGLCNDIKIRDVISYLNIEDVKALKDKGLYDNTVIMFSTDHGEMLGDFGTMGKRSMLDGAAHIPFMLRVPGIKAGHRDDVCSLVDVAPTLMKLAGADFDKDGIDGVDLFGGETHTEVYSQYSTGKKGAYMVATDRDKLVYHGGTGRYFYFDTIPEDTNKYDESNPRVMELKALLDKYMSEDRSNADFAATADEVSGVNKMPYGPKRCDHLLRQAEELARMPAGYPIDL